MTILSTNLGQSTENFMAAALADIGAFNEWIALFRQCNKLFTTDLAGAIGAAAATGNVASESIGVVNRTLLTLTAVGVTARDTQQGGGTKIYDFPEGRILILGAVGTMQFTTTSALAGTLHASSSCRWGVGTVSQSNATLATTEQDILPVTTFTSSATVSVINTATSVALAASAQFDGTSTAKDAILNVSVPSGADIDADATLTCTGTVRLTWINLGDY